METYYNMNVIGYYLGVLKDLEEEQKETKVILERLGQEIKLIRQEIDKKYD